MTVFNNPKRKENQMATTARLEIPEWTGSALTVGAFSEETGDCPRLALS